MIYMILSEEFRNFEKKINNSYKFKKILEEK